MGYTRRKCMVPVDTAITLSPKIVEVDTGRPSKPEPELGRNPSPPQRPCPLRIQVPAHISTNRPNPGPRDEGGLSSACRSSRRDANSGELRAAVATPRRVLPSSDKVAPRYLNYMGNTESSKAKFRSQSVPKQGPDRRPQSARDPVRNVVTGSMEKSVHFGTQSMRHGGRRRW